MDNPAFDFPVDPYITDADNEFAHSAAAFADDCLPPETQYSSLDQLFEAIQRWAANRGYAFSIGRSRTTSSSKKRIEYYCDRHTSPPRTSRTRTRKTSGRGTNCQFSIIAKQIDDATWQICHRSGSKFSTHNHEPSPGEWAHPSHRTLSVGIKEQILELHKVGITPRDIQTLIRSSNEDSLHTKQDIYNQLKRSRVDKHNGQSNMAALISTLNSNGYWYQIQLGDDNRVHSILFSNINSLQLIKRYPRIIIMDCTYKTNKYNMPLLHIIGIDACFNTFGIAFAFLQNEQSESYSWVLQQLRELFTTQEISPPEILVCDNWKATLIAAEAIFPAMKIQLCLWHISKAVLANCKAEFQSTTETIWRAKQIARATMQARNLPRAIQDKSLGESVEEALLEQAIISATTAPIEKREERLDDAWNEFMNDWYAILNAVTIPQYEIELKKFCGKYKKHYQNQVDYLQNTWLNPHKEKIVRAWTNFNRNYSIVTTSRAEGFHSMIKKYIKTSKKDINDVWQAIHHATQQQLQNIEARHQFEQVNTPSDLYGKIYANIRGWVSFHALRLVRQQELRLKDPEIPLPRPCTGVFRQIHGVPCAHDIERLISQNHSLRLDHFDPQWHLQRAGQPTYIEEPAVLQPRSSIIRRADIPASSTQRDPSLFEIVEQQPRRRPTCSRCHQTGHTMTSRQCPERNNLNNISDNIIEDTTHISPSPMPMPTPIPNPEPRLSDNELINRPEVIHQYYLQDREKWYKTLPSRAARTDSAYRRAKKLKPISRFTKRQFDWCTEIYQMGRQCGKGRSARPWTKEEMISYLDFRAIYDRKEDDEADQREQELCEREGYGTRYRGTRHIWQKLIDAQAQEYLNR